MSYVSEMVKGAAPIKGQKKALRAFYAQQRGSWGPLNPVSRRIPSGKTYKRSAFKAECR